MITSDSSRRAAAVTQQTFTAFIMARPKVIVLVGCGVTPECFLPGVIEHFAADLGDDVAFGSFDTSGLYQPWLLKHVGRVFTQVPDVAPPGYYLFTAGAARAFYAGSVDFANNDAAQFLGGGAIMLSLATWSLKPLVGAAKVFNNSTALQVIDYFERAMRTPPAPDSSFDWSSLFQPPKSVPGDPYHTLDIAPSATREEVEKAYKIKTAEAHPDKVARLAPEIQRCAHDLMVRANAAYNEICRLRGWR